MPWWPPAPQSNNICYLSDFYYFELEGVSRFADYSVPCTMYWPWLAWGTIDADWVAGEAMVRCQLLPPVALPIPAVHDDLIGAILSFGKADGPEYWEVVETLQWWFGDPPSLNFVLLWARPHIVIPPPPPEPITGGATWDVATPVSANVLYEVTVGAVDQWFAFPDAAASSFDWEVDNQSGSPAVPWAEYEGYSGAGPPSDLGMVPYVGNYSNVSNVFLEVKTIPSQPHTFNMLVTEVP